MSDLRKLLIAKRAELQADIDELEEELAALREAYDALPESMSYVEKQRYWRVILEVQGEIKALRDQVRAINILLKNL